jgi:glycerophosphoryl diester phosphodiesterase
MPQWIAEAKVLGLTTNSWTINKEEEMSWLLDQGVNFITTDEPEKLSILLQSKK